MSRAEATRKWPPQERRGDRLRAVNLDPLETIGLPSKGDERLLEFQTQEEYYGKILQRYERFCTGAESGGSLDQAFASLSLNGTSVRGSLHDKDVIEKTHAQRNASHGVSNTPKELSTIVMAMRKIREGIVSSARKDTFALRAYIFIIRATILVNHMESYHPALLYLLRVIHLVTPLTVCEYDEFVGYYILDLACRQNDLAAAYQMKVHYRYRNDLVEAVVRSLVHSDWYSFWKIETKMTKHQQHLMAWTEENMRSRALGCIGKSYLSVEKTYLEKAIQWPWEELVEKIKLGWQLEGDIIVIRKPKGK